MCTQTGDYTFDFFIAAGAFINLVSAYGREKYMRREFVLTLRIQAEQEQSEKFLYQMIPEYVAKQIKIGKRGIVERYENVTILYSDIKGEI